MTRSRSKWLPAGLLLLVLALELGAILLLNEGRFAYTLDDAYVHLATAETVSRGGYGIGPERAGSPSSSVLWPLILAPVARTPTGHYLPLAINVVASLATLLLVHRALGGSLTGREEVGSWGGVCFLTALAIPALNLPGLTFTGMEHSLQVLLTVVFFLGLAREGTPPWWLGAAIVVAPLVRYDTLALSVPALAVLAWLGHRRAAAVAAGGLVAGLGAFSALLWASGRGLLPTSVLARQEFLRTGTAGDLVAQLERNLTHRQGALLMVAATALLAVALSPGRSRLDRALAAWGAAAAGLHVVCGSFGWFSRYEIYVWAAVSLVLVHLARGFLRPMVRRGLRPADAALAILLVCAVATPYLYASAMTPLASNNIYQQHFQLYRFVHDYYRGPVAANDIGRLAYRNDFDVVDLFGLGDPTSLAARREWRGAAWMNSLARRHGAELAMIYDWWFLDLPGNWIPVGELHLGRPRVTPSGATVTFYVLDPSALPRVERLLREFVPTLPDGVSFDFRDSPGSYVGSARRSPVSRRDADASLGP